MTGISLIRRFVLCCGLALLLGGFAWAASAADQSFATANQLFSTGHDQQAITELQKFIAAYPADPRLYDAVFMLGRSYQRQQVWDQAEAAFTKVATKATAPEKTKLRADAYFQLGECHIQQREYADAEGDYRACLKLAGDNTDLAANAEYWLGECLFQLGRLNEALAEYRRVPEIDPKHELAPWAYYSMGMVLLNQKNYAEAIRVLEGAAGKYDDPEVGGNSTLVLALAYAGRARAAKDAAAAAPDFAKAVQLLTTVQGNMDISSAARQQATIGLAQIYADQQNYDKAAGIYAKLLENMDAAAPQALALRMARAEALYSAEHYSDAAAEYARVAESKVSAEQAQMALYWLGNCRYQVALKEKDKTAYTQAVEAFRRFLAAAGTGHTKAARASLLLALSYEDLITLGDATARANALTAYKDVLDKWPASREAGEARNALARLTSTMTVAEMQQYAPLLPEGDAAWSVSLRLAVEAFKGGNYQDALTAAQKVLEGKPPAETAASAAYLCAAACHRLKRAKDAIPYYQQALANTKTGSLTLFAQRGLVSAYLDTQHYDEAHTAAKALAALPVQAKTGPEREQELAERYLMLAQASAGAKQFDDAAAAYGRISKECPSSSLVPEALMGLGWVADNKKDRPAAIAAYQELTAKFPEHKLAAEAWFRLGTDLNEQKEFQRAIDAFQKVPASASYADQAAYAIAWANQDLDKSDDAYAAFNRLVEQFPKSPLAGDSLFRISEYWMKKKNDGEALRALNRAMEVLPADSKLRPTVAYRIGSTAFEQGNFALAAASYDKVLTDFPTCEFVAESLFWKAQALEQQGGHAAAAREAYLQYVAKFATGEKVLDAALGAGRTALADKQYAAALTDLRKALELCGKLGKGGALLERANNVQPEAQYLIGQCSQEQKNYSDAITAYAAVAAYNMEPWYSRSMLQMARCSALSGDTKSAILTLRQLIKQFPTSDAAKEAPKVAEEYGLKLGE